MTRIYYYMKPRNKVGTMLVPDNHTRKFKALKLSYRCLCLYIVCGKVFFHFLLEDSQETGAFTKRSLPNSSKSGN